MTPMGLNAMNKKELRAKLAADAERWREENGDPELIAAVSSPQEHFMICGYKYKRKHLRPNDPKHERYQQWLREEEKARVSA